MEDKEGAATRELSGAEEALGLGDCYAFILLCRRLLKHNLRKKDFKAGWLLLCADLLIPTDT